MRTPGYSKLTYVICCQYFQVQFYTAFYQQIAMASAVFVEGTPSQQLIALSQKALPQEDPDFMVCANPSIHVVLLT